MRGIIEFSTDLEFARNVNSMNFLMKGEMHENFDFRW